MGQVTKSGMLGVTVIARREGTRMNLSGRLGFGLFVLDVFLFLSLASNVVRDLVVHKSLHN